MAAKATSSSGIAPAGQMPLLLDDSVLADSGVADGEDSAAGSVLGATAVSSLGVQKIGGG